MSRSGEIRGSVGRSDIERELGRIDEAAADAARALTLSRQDTQPGTFSSQLGQTYLTLGRALQAQGKQDQARAAFRTDAQSFQSTLGAGSPDAYRARQLAGMDSQPIPK